MGVIFEPHPFGLDMVNNVVRAPNSYVNEPVLGCLPGSEERAQLKAELVKQESEIIEISVHNQREENVFTGDIAEQVMPHDHSHVIARVHMAGEKWKRRSAINAAVDARKNVVHDAIGTRIVPVIFRKASELLAGPRRAELSSFYDVKSLIENMPSSGK